MRPEAPVRSSASGMNIPMSRAAIEIRQGVIEPRTVHVSECCPPSMMRSGAWRLEDFNLQKQLYKGKASLLYKATCRVSGLPVALKLYRKLRLSALNWYQVQREIRIHSQLQHKNIVQLYAAFEDSDHVYLALEYANGGDLYEELKRCGGHLSEERVASDILRPCLAALAYLHLKGYLWRDCKPENILLAGPGLSAVKLADFGLSIDSTEERPVTRAGTLDYMAPEVVLCPEKSQPKENKEKALLGYTCSVDTWAIGILGYELIVGHPPFERDTRSDTYEQIMYRRPNYPGWISEESRMFISAALTKSARKRPTVADLMNHPWILKHCPVPKPAPAAACQSEVGNEDQIAATCHNGAREQEQEVLAAPVFDIMVECSRTSDAMVIHEAAESSPDRSFQSLFQWAGSSMHRLSSRLLASATTAQDNRTSFAGLSEGAPSGSRQPQTIVAPPSDRQRKASTEGGSLATLFYPPLHKDHQLADPAGSGQPADPSAAFSSPKKLNKIMAAGRDADGMDTCSTPTAIKAHHGHQGDRETGPSEGCPMETPREMDAARGPLPGVHAEWVSPARRRRPHGDSCGSLASTPPPRGPLRFPSQKEGRTSEAKNLRQPNLM